MNTRMIVAPTRTTFPLDHPLVLFVDLVEGVIGVTADPVIQDQGRTRFVVLPAEHGRPTKEATTTLATDLAPIAEHMLDDWTLDEGITAVEVLPDGRDQEDPDQIRLGETAEQAWNEILAKATARRWDKAEQVFILGLETHHIQDILTQGAARDLRADDRLSVLLDNAEREYPGYGAYAARPGLESYIQGLQEARSAAYKARFDADKQKDQALARELARDLMPLLMPYTTEVGVSDGAHLRTIERLKEVSPELKVNHAQHRKAVLKLGERFFEFIATMSKRTSGRWHMDDGTLLQALEKAAR